MAINFISFPKRSKNKKTRLSTCGDGVELQFRQLLFDVYIMRLNIPVYRIFLDSRTNPKIYALLLINFWSSYIFTNTLFVFLFFYYDAISLNSKNNFLPKLCCSKTHDNVSKALISMSIFIFLVVRRNLILQFSIKIQKVNYHLV